MVTKRKLAKAWACLALLPFTACTEKIVIDPPAEKKMVVVEGYLSDEYKQHEVILSYSSPLYEGEREMISGAEVYVVGGGDTIWYHEQEDKPGHYLTDSLAAQKRRRYHFEARVEENELQDRPIRLYAESYMPNNVAGIDSLRLLPLKGHESIPFVDGASAVCACPYFQTLSDANIVYMVELFLDNSLIKNWPSEYLQIFPMSGYAGYYFNGPEMLEKNNEVFVGILSKEYLYDGRVVKVKLHSITRDYMGYLLYQKVSNGSNPVLGAYPLTSTNIMANCNAIGWFRTTSVVEAEAIYYE